MSKGQVRRIRLRGVVAFPAVSVALVVSVALALTPFGPGQGIALAASPTPTQTSTPDAPSATAATSAPTTAQPTTTEAPTTASPTTAGPTTAAPTTADPTTAGPTTDGPTTAALTTLGPVPNPVPGADPSLAAALAAVPVGHHMVAQIGSSDFLATYLAVDAPVTSASQFQTFRVRFQVGNAETTPVTANPQLEYRALGAADFVVVPDKPTPGVAFRAGREWVPNAGAGGGTQQGPLGADIAVADLRMASEFGATAEAAIGHRSMGVNPDQPIILAPDSYTEQEFTVGLTIDAKYLTGYELRITDAGTEMAGTSIATITLGSAPLLWLSPNQRQGLTVVDPAARNAAGATFPLLDAPTPAADQTSDTPAAVSPPSAAAYPLASGALSPAVVGVDIPVGESSNTHSQCAACHRGHTSQGLDLTKESMQSTLCFSCHDSAGVAAGTGAKDVKSQYALLPQANNPENREYYSHDAISSTPSTTRPSGCADCHNSHEAEGTDSTQASDGTGWTASGRLAGVSGVSVVNGGPGTEPTYTPLDGVQDVVTREYQLCFKCHSGATTLTSNAGLKPSQYALDKGVELNPANPSFHPVEAAGKNDTAKMTDSLVGTSPYKRWNFNTASTVRCLNCHAGGAPEPPAPPVLPPGSSLAPHASSNRGILLENYLDRELKPRTDTSTAKAAYSAGDFALCYVCHAEAPFANKSDPADGSSNATNFKLHGLHLTGLAGKGTGGTEIDTAGDGQGNATCAECHFRIHSTTNKVGPQEIPGSRLVNFAPNVQGSGGAISWAPGSTGSGSCALTCHGYEHKGNGYSN